MGILSYCFFILVKKTMKTKKACLFFLKLMKLSLKNIPENNDIFFNFLYY